VKSGGKVSDPNPLPFAMAGMPGEFPFDRARQLGLVRVAAESRRDVADLFGLSPASIKDDPLDGRSPVAFRYVLRGAIDSGVKEATRRVLQDVARKKGTVLFVQLECGDGDLSAARDIADEFQKAQHGEDGLLVVGFVPESATPAASVIAFGCGEIVMSKRADAGGDGPEAEICDFEPVLNRGDAGAVEFLRKNLKELAAAHGIPDLLIDGMLDRELVIVRARAANDPTRVRLMSEPEFEAAKPNWVAAGTVKPKGQLLKLNATRAVELGVARNAVNGRDMGEVYAYYGIDPSAVTEATPGWLDRFATFLRLPPVTVLLVVLGFAGLILELKVPGTTVPGIIAALCFILIFWAHTGVNGNAVILGGMVFLLGLVLILIEVFVLPGFGAPGILGVLFMLGGIGLATLDRIPQTGDEWTEFGGKVGQYMLAMIGAVVLAFTVARFLPNIPYANRLMLAPPGERPDPDGGPDLPGAAQAAALLGAVGSAATMLRPAGMAQFADQYVDVVTEGGFIAAGARVQVVEVEGTRIVVREV
jgi:membrane-bound serine protease (ClpP class)